MALKDLIKQAQQSRLGKAIQSVGTGVRAASRTSGVTDLLSGSLQNINNTPRGLFNTIQGQRTGNQSQFQTGQQQLYKATQGGNRAFGSELDQQGKFRFTGTGAPRVALTAAGMMFPGAKVAATVGGGLSAGFNAVQGGNIAEGFGSGLVTGLQSNTVSGVTNPYIAKLLPKGTGAIASRVLPAAANVGQGMLIDKATGQQTTPLSAAIDLGVGLVGGKGQFQTKQLGKSRLKQPEVIPKEQPRNLKGQFAAYLGIPESDPRITKMANIWSEAKGKLSNLSTKKRKQFIDLLPPKVRTNPQEFVNYMTTARGGSNAKWVNKPDGTGMVDISKGRFTRPPEQAMGAVAGFEPEYDEDGKILGFKYNPTMGALGVAGSIVGKKALDATSSRTGTEPTGKLRTTPTGQVETLDQPRVNQDISLEAPSSQIRQGLNTPLETRTNLPLGESIDTRSPGLEPLVDQTTTSKLKSPQQTTITQPVRNTGVSPSQMMDIAQVGRSAEVGQRPGETKQRSLVGQSQPYFNSKNYNVEPKARKLIDQTVLEVKPAIEKVVGKKLSNQEVIQKANATARVFTRAVDRESTEAWEAALLKTRQKLAALSQEGKVDQEYLQTLVTLKSLGTDIGRKLQSFGIGADPKLVTSKQMILEAVTKVEKDTDKILKAAEGVDFNDLNQATAFYRKFVKPSLEEKLDLLRYNSMLSSPNTHINNAFSNYQGTGIIAPIEKTIAGGVDALRSVLNGKPRTRFAGEGMAYAKAYYSNFNKALTAFSDVLKGKSLMNAPDMRNIPLYPSGRMRKYENLLAAPMKVLEATDQFFTALTKAGVEGSLNYRQGKAKLKGIDIKSMAEDEAARRLFRSELGENNGSLTLNALDIVANKVQSLKGSENPIIRTISKYSLPFLRTPTNILKQGVEYSPFGLTTLPGSKDKTEQLSKMILGSSIGAGVALLVGGDRMTWAEPTGEKQKQAFKAAGLQPYSIKVGNKWVSYSKMHPAISFNLALVAAIRNAEENKTLDDGQIETVLNGAAKWVNFFADQSYVKNIGDLVSATKGDVEGLAKIPANYVQQFVPFRALMGWVARLTDPYQRQVDTDGSLLEKQLGFLATQIPLLSQTVPARLDQFDNPIENQNRMLNAVSPLKVTTENDMAKEDYNFLKEKAKFEKDKKYMRSKLKDEAETVITTPQASASDSEYIPGTGLRKLSEIEKDKVGTYLEFGKAVSRESLENLYLGDLAELPSGNRYETSLKKKAFLSKLSTIKNDDKLSTEQKTALKERIAAELKLTVPELDNYVIAGGTVDEKTLYAYDKMDEVASQEDFLRYLANGRKPLNGQMLVSDDVINNLVEDGIIPEDLGKAFKNLDLNEDGTVKKGKIKGRSGSAKKNMAAVNDYFESLKKIGAGSSKIRTTSPLKVSTKGLTFSS